MMSLCCLLYGGAALGQLNVARLDSLGTWVPYPQGGGTYQLQTTTVTLNSNCTITQTSQSNDTLAWNENYPGFFQLQSLYTIGTVTFINLLKQAFPNFTFTPPPDFDPALNKQHYICAW